MSQLVCVCVRLHRYVAVCLFVYAYFAELSDASVCGLPSMLSIYSVLFEEQVDFVIFWVVALWNQMNTHKPGICNTQKDTHI